MGVDGKTILVVMTGNQTYHEFLQNYSRAQLNLRDQLAEKLVKEGNSVSVSTEKIELI